MTITGDDTFEWRGRTLRYLDHPYNTTIRNERAVEVPIANAWAEEHETADPDFLEVGNVMQHYGWSGHRVVDKHEVADGVLNEDVFMIAGTYDLILAVSTLEHVGWDVEAGEERLPGLSRHALAHLRLLLKPGGHMLVTVPFGQNPYLDVSILEGLYGDAPDQESTMVRDWRTGDWSEVLGRHWTPAREMGWASSVWVATWGPE